MKIDPDFQVHVRESATGELRRLESLSRGTQDQLYFALRFGVLDLVSKPDEPSPCLLDEPFAAYDGSRLAEAMHILVEEARRQADFCSSPAARTCTPSPRDPAHLSSFHTWVGSTRSRPNDR